MSDLHGVANDFNFAWPQPDPMVHRVASPDLGPLETQCVSTSLKEGWVGPDSPWVRTFETELGNLLAAETLAVSNGSVALILALAALEIGFGDEVIVPSLTYAATASSVIHLGALPVFVDVDPTSWTIDVLKVALAITPATKAVIAVHLYGNSANMTELKELCSSEGLFLIEDTAEAFTGTWNGDPLGTIGDIGTFSFFANKLITTGEGGAVATKNSGLQDRMRLLRGQGMDPKSRYNFLVPGFNFRMSSMQAALGVAQLRRLDEIVDKRTSVEEFYAATLEGIITRPRVHTNGARAPWLFTGTFAEDMQAAPVKTAVALAGKGIETRPVFRPLPLMRAFESYRCTGCQVASAISTRGITLPTSSEISEETAHKISMIVTEGGI